MSPLLCRLSYPAIEKLSATSSQLPASWYCMNQREALSNNDKDEIHYHRRVRRLGMASWRLKMKGRGLTASPPKLTYGPGLPLLLGRGGLDGGVLTTE
jgi:hypothetical protein